ncbi:tail fiber domain-containing protein [Burkholderia contaminans]|uniref:tail fiber domain-containing protein n=1 Tax=Burkholderia contaminans TaxID=488447 RepID=UPI0018DEA78A|nr:tail fiber domain-containing protein [Burkholderia contaminans]MBH9725110.1 tail fiber domain-containing protein [Burkholderia contaminans]
MGKLQKINLGTPPKGVDGDNNRVAHVKVNASIDVLDRQSALVSAPMITASRTLGEEHIGRRVSINIAAGGTIKLRKASLCEPDSIVWLVNVGVKRVLLAPDDGSGDTVSISGLNSGEAVALDADGVSAWRVLMRSRASGDDETVSGKLAIESELSVGGVATFAKRPTFAGKAPWDSGNFNPADYASLSGATFTGNASLGPFPNQPYSRYLYFAASGFAPFVRSNNSAKTVEFVNSANTMVNLSIMDGGEVSVARRISVGSAENYSKIEVRGFGNNRGWGVWMQASTFDAQPIAFVNPEGYQCGGINMSANAVAYTSASDYRIKDIEGAFDRALDVVRAVPVWEYRLKNDPGRGTVVGFIAHELKLHVPHAVFGEKDAIAGYVPVYREGYVVPDNGSAPGPADVVGVREVPALQTVDKTELVPYLWAAVQQLASRLEAVEALCSIEFKRASEA